MSWLFGASRRNEVEGYCKTSGQAIALAMTFLNGKGSSSLNDILFHKIVNAIKADISRDRDKQAQAGYKLIAHYSTEEHKELYLREIRTCSVEPSHGKTTSHSSSVAAL